MSRLVYYIILKAIYITWSLFEINFMIAFFLDFLLFLKIICIQFFLCILIFEVFNVSFLFAFNCFWNSFSLSCLYLSCLSLIKIHRVFSLYRTKFIFVLCPKKGFEEEKCFVCMRKNMIHDENFVLLVRSEIHCEFFFFCILSSYHDLKKKKKIR